ncbi:MAG: mobile mystery protein A [Chitinophagaceae bacterium]
MIKTILLHEQLEGRMRTLANPKAVTPLPTGWIRAVRLALGIRAQQLGKKLAITRQAVVDMEKREVEGTITLKSLQDAAVALDMKLVYGFVPKDGSLDALIERKAKELAMQIVMRTSQTMLLEEQANTEERLKKAIEDRTNELKRDMPKTLWD